MIELPSSAPARPKRLKFWNIVGVLIASLFALVCIAYWMMPTAMSSSQFQIELKTAAESNFRHLNFTTEIAKQEKVEIDRKFGPATKVVSIERIVDMKFNYPTLQVVVTVRRGDSNIRESYTFVVDKAGKLVIIGITSPANY